MLKDSNQGSAEETTPQNKTNSLVDLHKKVCEFFGEYQEQDKELQLACQQEPNEKNSNKILSSLKNLQIDYQRCE
jgi:hypothetical protein